METFSLYFFVFLLAGYSFVFGCEFGYRIYRKSIISYRVIEPRFRVIYRNPKLKNNQGRKNSLERR